MSVISNNEPNRQVTSLRDNDPADQNHGDADGLEIPERLKRTAPVIEFHPLAGIFPLLEGPDFEELVANVRQHGLIEPVVMHEDKILDGRNRYRACSEAGVEPTFTPFRGDDPLAYIISVNLCRRHLTPEQKRKVIAKVAAAQPEKSDRQIAKMVKADHKTVAKARAEGEDVGTIPHVETRTDTIGRRQPAKKRRTVEDFTKEITAKNGMTASEAVTETVDPTAAVEAEVIPPEVKITTEPNLAIPIAAAEATTDDKDLVKAWHGAGAEERRTFLATIGSSALFEAMPAQMRAELDRQATIYITDRINLSEQQRKLLEGLEHQERELKGVEYSKLH